MPVAEPGIDQEQQVQSKDQLAPGFKVICWDDPVNLMDYVTHVFEIITIRILVPQHQLVTRGGSLILRADIGKQLSHRHLLKRVDAHNL